MLLLNVTYLSNVVYRIPQASVGSSAGEVVNRNLKKSTAQRHLYRRYLLRMKEQINKIIKQKKNSAKNDAHS